MAGFFKKAMSVFVEFEEDPNNPANNTAQPIKEISKSVDGSKVSLSNDELDKFEKHFESIIDQANLPGPDYYEFFKMSETLEGAVPDEKTRFSAVFASLAVQGLTKAKLINSAAAYKTIINEDKSKFEAAVNEKLKSEVESKKKQSEDLNKKIAQNSELIKKLTLEITEAQEKLKTLNSAVEEEENKLKSSISGYSYACNAMLNKINVDIQKIDSLL